MALEDALKAIQKAEQEITHLIETRTRSIEERIARGETPMDYDFTYEHGEGKRGSVDIVAYDVQDAFSMFGYQMKVHNLHPRNICYEIVDRKRGNG